MRKYVTIDLNQIKRDLEEHYDPLMQEEYKGHCECGEKVGQDIDECPFCNKLVIWFNSPLWKEMYGNPRAARVRATLIRPTNKKEEYLCSRAGVLGFQGRGEHSAFSGAADRLSFEEVKETIDYCLKQLRKKGSGKGRALIVYAINALEQKAASKGDLPADNEEMVRIE